MNEKSQRRNKETKKRFRYVPVGEHITYRVKILSQKFDDAYEEFLKELSREESGAYLGLDKTYELFYLRGHKDRFKTIFLSIPSSKKNQIKILDIGTTAFTFVIKKFYRHYDISTIDLTDLMKKRCEKKDITFRECNLMKNNIPFEDNSFDVVIFTEVLEHLFINPSQIFSGIYRVLKKDGILVFGTPNCASLFNRVRLLVGINPTEPLEKQMEEQSKENWVHGYGHLRLYTMKECITILKNNGFTIIEAKFATYWNKPKLALSKMGFITLMYNLICLCVPPFRGGIHVIAKK